MEKKKPKARAEEEGESTEEESTFESQILEEGKDGGFPDDVDFKRFLGCGG